MKRIIVLFTIVSFLSFGDSFAQVNKGNFTLFGNILFPQRDFAHEGGIKIGSGFGIEYSCPIDAPGISWVTSASLLKNGKDNSDEFKGGIGIHGPIIKGNYYNIPILTGFKTRAEAPHILIVYGILQIGLNFVKPPSYSGENYSGETYKTSFDFAKSLGFGIGGGLVIFDKFNFGIRFYNFGEAKIKGESKYDGKTVPMNEFNKSLSMLLVTFGIQF